MVAQVKGGTNEGGTNEGGTSEGGTNDVAPQKARYGIECKWQEHYFHVKLLNTPK